MGLLSRHQLQLVENMFYYKLLHFISAAGPKADIFVCCMLFISATRPKKNLKDDKKKDSERGFKLSADGRLIITEENDEDKGRKSKHCNITVCCALSGHCQYLLVVIHNVV